jgi:hypothetical protein
MEYNVIGTINKSTGVMLTDDEGFEYPETAPIEGFHVNTLPEFMTEELEPFVVEPSTPLRIFSGRTDTVALKFANEEEFKAVTGYEDL